MVLGQKVKGHWEIGRLGIKYELTKELRMNVYDIIGG